MEQESVNYSSSMEWKSDYKQNGESYNIGELQGYKTTLLEGGGDLYTKAAGHNTHWDTVKHTHNTLVYNHTVSKICFILQNVGTPSYQNISTRQSISNHF